MKTNIYNFVFYVVFYIIAVIVPVIYYIRYIVKENPIEYLKLKKNCIKGIIVGSSISVVFILILLVIKYLTLGVNSINLNIGYLWIYGILSGIMEEIPIRGFLLKKISTSIGFLRGNVVTSVIFLTLHFPKWIYLGEISLRSMAINFFMSLIFGYLVKEYNSLWPSIICHSTLNITIYIGL